jgi:peptidoglycan/LPS O-acetylase OafA/YrhL
MHQAMNHTERTYYRGLDGLRAVAVLIVMAAHVGAPYPLSGGAGVDIFFVMSGFLITSILAAEHRRHGAISLRNFYARRMLRLAPCLIAVCAAFAVVHVARAGVWPTEQLMLALTYTANWGRAVYDVDMLSLGHCWSLAIEEQFYLVWPFAVLGIELVSRNSMRKAAILLLAAMTIAAYRAAMTKTYTPERIYFGLDTHMDGLVLGSSLGYLVRAVHLRGGLSSGSSILLSYIGTPLALMAIAVVMGTITWLDAWMGRTGYLLVAAAAAVVIADLTLSDRSLLQRPLSMRLPVYIGRISYGLYLWHYPIFHALDHVWPDTPLHVMMPVGFGVTLLVAVCSFHWFEQPFLRLKNRFERTPKPRNDRPAPAPIHPGPRPGGRIVPRAEFLRVQNSLQSIRSSASAHIRNIRAGHRQTTQQTTCDSS